MNRRIGRRAVWLVAIAAVGCADDGPSDRSDAGARRLAVEVVAEGFDGPTQIGLAPDGRLIVAELGGGEDDGTGRVISLDLDDPSDRDLLVDDLLTPTGVAVDGDRLWIMEQRRLTVGPYAGPGDRIVVLDEMPYNGRSQGTLTSLPGGGVLFDTSGRRVGDALEPGSGVLWRLAAPDREPEVIATGFKHAYAHVIDDQGQLWSTEMSDGSLDGAVPADELVRVVEGADFGYPRCVGDGTPVAELGATEADCASAPASHALFDPGATPTSVVVAPWDRDVLVVALWNRGEIVGVPRLSSATVLQPEVLVTGVTNPQHLVRDGERLLVSDFGTGRILAISEQ